jgi:hypothetical protein
MSDTQVKQEVAAILKLGKESFSSWDILSSVPEENLYLVHYKTDYTNSSLSDVIDVEKYGDLRGIVVDTQAKTVVCRSFGYTPTVVTSWLGTDRIAEDGTMELVDEDQVPHTLDMSKVTIKPGFEGTMMRVFLHNGKVYRCTHRRLDPSRSRWGNSISFSEMYEELHGPSNEDLFDMTKKYSPFVHMFLMVHPDVLSCTKQDVGVGYMVYVGNMRAWDVNSSPYPNEETEQEAKSLQLSSLIPTSPSSPVVIGAPKFTLEEATEHLQRGFADASEAELATDERLGSGEFVMLYIHNDKGEVDRLLKVSSYAYHWRSQVRANDPNILHRMYQLVDDSYIRTEIPEGMNLFESKYPLIQQYRLNDVEEFIRSGTRRVWVQDEGDKRVLSTKEGRLYTAWVSLLMSVPLHRQTEVINAYKQLFSSRNELVGWLRKLYDTKQYLNKDANLPNRVVSLITQAENFAHVKASRGQNKNLQGRYMSIQAITKDNIRNLISKENGNSLYRMVKEMNFIKADKAKPQ